MHNRHGRACQVYLDWITPKPVVQEGCPPGEYVDNLFTRSFSGRCVAPPAAKPRPRGDPRPSAARYQRIWNNDVCGQTWGGWRGGCAYNENRGATASDADLAVALAVVDRFDVVLVLEWLASATYRAYAAARFGVGRFDVAHRNSRQRHSGRDWRPQPEAVAAVLRHRERHDAALVARARANECADATAWLAARSDIELAPNDPPCFSDAAA